MSNRSRLWATGLLVAAFVAGLAVGGAAQAALADRDDRPGRERSRRLSYPERLERDLQLTPEQRTAVETVMQRHQQSMRDIWRAAERQVDTMRLQIRNEIMDVLDARQREAYGTMNMRHDSLHAARERGEGRRR
ncbi:MAG TPA: periplasmic heavy metal sensor [Gemmatimonadales bacterium]